LEPHLPDFLYTLDPAAISKNKAEETLLYVRYHLQREKNNKAIEVLQHYQSLIQARLKELEAKEEEERLQALSGIKDKHLLKKFPNTDFPYGGISANPV
jgi:hypothetical protein